VRVGGVQVGGRDVREVDLPDGADAELLCPRPRALEVLEIEDRHVAAVATVTRHVPPRRGVLLHRRDDLEEGVADREDRVLESEEAHARIVEGLADSEA